MEKLSRQEMFERAWKGLAEQEFRKAQTNGSCSYQTPNGDRCAWGHVDTSLTARDIGSVRTLVENKVGLAALLSVEDTAFAMALQRAHDCSKGDLDMKHALRLLASDWQLNYEFTYNPEYLTKSLAPRS